METSAAATGQDNAFHRIFSKGRLFYFDKTDSLAGIDFFAERGPPPVVIEIPLHCLAESAGETLFGPPAEFALNLTGIDGIPLIMTRSICHIRQVAIVRFSLRVKLIECITNASYDLQVR